MLPLYSKENYICETDQGEGSVQNYTCLLLKTLPRERIVKSLWASTGLQPTSHCGGTTPFVCASLYFHCVRSVLDSSLGLKKFPQSKCNVATGKRIISAFWICAAHRCIVSSADENILRCFLCNLKIKSILKGLIRYLRPNWNLPCLTRIFI